MRIINVLIEPLFERYSEQWSHWIPAAQDALKLEHAEVMGLRMTDKIETGEVLDAYDTNYWKATQLAKLIQMIRSGEITDDDILFFHDLWFPGLESLQYIRDMAGKKFKIKGILHAGTWDKNDFTYRHGMRCWGKMIERGWLRFVDEVFVATQYHKDLIVKSCPQVKNRIKVTGLFFDADEVQKLHEKENIVVFPHRLDPEKRPDRFDILARRLKARMPDWQFIKTKDVCKTKDEYYNLLGRAKIAVSFAEQETFGFAMLEAVANGCAPVVPDRLSYAEMPPYEGCRFKGMSEAIELVLRASRAELFDCRGFEYSPKTVMSRMFL